MKALVDRTHALSRGLAAIRSQFKVPEAFPADVLAAADAAALASSSAICPSSPAWRRTAPNPASRSASS